MARLTGRHDEVAEHGDVFIQIDAGTAVLARRAGTLWLCKCTKWGWECEEAPTGATRCYQQCVKWECEEAPAKVAFRSA